MTAAPRVFQVRAEEEKGAADGEEEEDWERALSVERFGDIISESATSSGEKMGRCYNEKDFECTYPPPLL